MDHPTRINLPNTRFDIRDAIKNHIVSIDRREVVGADVAEIILVLLAAFTINPARGWSSPLKVVHQLG